jgi:ABC-type Zn2+ transport system substrate-binding protein/surface adhesin
MPSRRSRREKNRAKKIAKLNDDCCVGESQDIEERNSFQEAHEKKKTCDRKRYKADPESKKDSMKAQYWLDPESKKESAKAYYDQNRELILASKQDQYQANPKAKRDISRINSRRKRNPMR